MRVRSLLVLRWVLGRRVGRSGVATGVLGGSAAVAEVSERFREMGRRESVQVSGVALGVAGVVCTELAALLTVLEATVLGWAIGIYSCRWAEVVLWFLWWIALLAVVLALRLVALLLVIVLAWWRLVTWAAWSGGGVVGGVLVVWV